MQHFAVGKPGGDSGPSREFQHESAASPAQPRMDFPPTRFNLEGRFSAARNSPDNTGGRTRCALSNELQVSPRVRLRSSFQGLPHFETPTESDFDDGTLREAGTVDRHASPGMSRSQERRAAFESKAATGESRRRGARRDSRQTASRQTQGLLRRTIRSAPNGKGRVGVRPLTPPATTSILQRSETQQNSTLQQ
jgi:hypothetical protein